MTTSGGTEKVSARICAALALAATRSLRRISPRRASSIERAMRWPRRISSSSRSKAREIEMVSSASPSVVVKICASTILAPEAAQAPAMIDSRRGWSGATTVSSVTPRKASVDTSVASECISTALACSSSGVLDLVRQIDLEPIGRIMPGAVIGEFVVRPRRQFYPQFLLSLGDAALAVDRGMAAGEHDFGFPVKRAQQLAFPAVPHAGTDRPNVADGQDQQHFQPLDGLHQLGEAFDGAPVAEIAALGDIGHDEMVFDQPGRRLRLRLVQAQTRAELARDRAPRSGMILLAALGDVMQQQGHIKRAAMRDGRHDFAGQRQFGRALAQFHRGQFAQRAQQMLVHRIVVVHVELHHRDDAAEIGDEAAEHAGFVHQPQGAFARLRRGEDLDEQPVGFRVGAQFRVDARQGTGSPAARRRDGSAIHCAPPPRTAG